MVGPVKKWGKTLLVAAAFVAVALMWKFWAQPLLKHATQPDNEKTIEVLTNLATLISLVLAGATVVWKWWRARGDDATSKQSINLSSEHATAGRDAIQAGGNVQTGGFAISGPVTMHAGGQLMAVAAETYVEHQTIVQQPAAPIVSPPSPATALHGLPPPPADFTGRAAELAELRAAIEKGGVHISGLQGQGGVGKTALALKLAEKLTPQFPDAQLYLDLRGASAKPLSAAEAMSFVIRAFHPEMKLPEGEAELSAIYQSVLHSKRVLLLMDNARDAAQVRPLLPPGPCALVVTSRQHFALPGLQAKDLNTLPPPDAEALLLAVAPRIRSEAAMIAKLCGYLPLALRLAAGALVERPSLEPAEYARRLGDERQRLGLLRSGDQSMAACIELSYGLLGAAIQQRWRALAVFPETFVAPAAAAVWALQGDAAQDTLDRLLQYSMVEFNANAGRFRLHDLMHDFAGVRLEASECDHAARRQAAYYLELLGATGQLYEQGGNSVTQGLALFDLEWSNIHAGQDWAVKHVEQDSDAQRLCCNYPIVGAFCLDLRLNAPEWIRWLEAALAAARRLKDIGAEAYLFGSLGVRHRELGKYQRALEYCERHLTIAREFSDRRGEGQALGNLGNTYAELGEIRRAIEYHEQALAIDREIGDRRGEGQDLGNLGNAYADLGEYRRAIKYHEEALAIDREIGDRHGEAADLGNLGSAYGALREHRRAIQYSRQQLAITRAIGYRRGEGKALGNLGNAYADLGDYRRAIDYYEKELAITREMDDRQGECSTVGNLGLAYAAFGETRPAVECYAQQLAIAREIGHRSGEGIALFNTSLALDAIGERQRAVEHAEAALVIFEQIESPNAGMVRRQLEEWRG
jgi:tetratricopeptide (TPR) repeat protein